MKKFVLFSLIAGMFSSAALADVYQETVKTCDEAQMRAALDRATVEHRAVITIIECENGVVKVKQQNKVADTKPCNKCDTCTSCGEPMEQVVNREYFVRETVQQYKPVVQYVPAGTYTRVKPACNHGC